MLDREIPGIAEAARQFGQQHMPYAMLSRSVAGLKGKTLILALPGSTRGAENLAMDAKRHTRSTSGGDPEGLNPLTVPRNRRFSVSSSLSRFT